MVQWLLKLTAIAIIALFIQSCSYVRVKTDHGFMSPDVYIATDGKTEVRYYSGNCYLAKQVLESLAKKANDGDFEWIKMSDVSFREEMLKKQCEIEKNKTEGKH